MADLRCFYGVAEVQSDSLDVHRKWVTSDSFTQFGLERVDSLRRNTMHMYIVTEDQQHGSLVLLLGKPDEPLCSIRKLPYNDTVMVILQDVNCCDAVLTFWRQVGDSLEFACFYPQCFSGAAGGTYFDDVWLRGRRDSYVILTTSGGDDAGCWGSTHVAKCMLPNSLCFLKNYTWGTHDSTQTTLKPSFTARNGQLFVRLAWKDYYMFWNSDAKVTRDTSEYSSVLSLEKGKCGAPKAARER